jgi:hypothetical protein
MKLMDISTTTGLVYVSSKTETTVVLDNVISDSCERDPLRKYIEKRPEGPLST